MKGKRFIHETAESVRRQEIGRLRTMAAEAAARGDRWEAKKLDQLADEHAQWVIGVPRQRRKPVQLKLDLGL